MVYFKWGRNQLKTSTGTHKLTKHAHKAIACIASTVVACHNKNFNLNATCGCSILRTPSEFLAFGQILNLHKADYSAINNMLEEIDWSDLSSHLQARRIP